MLAEEARANLEPRSSAGSIERIRTLMVDQDGIVHAITVPMNNNSNNNSPSSDLWPPQNEIH